MEKEKKFIVFYFAGIYIRATAIKAKNKEEVKQIFYKTNDYSMIKDIKEIGEIKKRLEYLREEAENERLSYEELAELQSLADYIDPSDVFLLEQAGVPEFKK